MDIACIIINRPITLPMMRMRLLILPFSAFLMIFQTLISTSGYSQDFNEPFDNGFSTGLGWTGDVTAFAGVNGELQLIDSRPTAPGTAKVWVAANTQAAACWTLDIRLEFSPSASNKAIWWLAADRPLDQLGIQGVYIQAGGITGNDDAFELIRRSGSTNSLIATTSLGSAATDPVDASIRVCASGMNWTLELFPAVGSDESVSGTDTQVLSGQYSGFDLSYTSTRNGLFYFDNFTIDPLFMDVSAPELVLAQAVDANTVSLVSSEPLAMSAANAANYLISGNVVTAANLSGNEVLLSLQNTLPSGQATTISITSWEDLAGNFSGPLTATVTYVAPSTIERYELLISEIMFDPTPVIGLPNVEYIELYNASGSTINLADVELVKDNTSAFLPAVALEAGAFIALAGEDLGDSRFTVFTDLPSLTNSGARLGLKNLAGALIDQVEYSPDWHETTKDDGGYSLERKDLSQPCLLGGSNWTSSSALSGGTPGVVNASAEALEADSLAITKVTVIDVMTIEVALNRSLSSDLSVAFEVENLDVADVVETDRLGTYSILLTNALLTGEVGYIQLSRAAESCLGSDQQSLSNVAVGIAETAVPGDWELNEILYDPLTGQGRYVELANVSNKLLSTDQVFLSLLDADGNVGDLFLAEESILVPPGSYFVYSANVERLIQEFPRADQTLIIPTDVPTLGKEGCLQLFDPITEDLYWTVCYTEDWHNRAYANTDGVSLERISLAVSPNQSTNWTSAASTSNFGTPTRKNSQAREGEVLPEGEFKLASEKLSPDGDGFEDLLSLDFAFTDPGTLARFEVYDLLGRSVLTSDKDESPGLSGTWTWDGVTDDGGLAPVGTYLLRVTYWSPEASRKVKHLAFSLLLAR